MKYQDFLLGLADIYDRRLGVGDARYQVVHRYFDREPCAVLHAYGAHVAGGAQPLYSFDTPAYEAIGRAYTWEFAKTFPADIALRSWAAVLRTLDELTTGPSNPSPQDVYGSAFLAFYDLHAQLSAWSARPARYAVLAALVLLAIRRPRLGLGVLFLLLYFAGHSAIQFASRHMFHLQFLALWPLGFLLSNGWRRVPGLSPVLAGQRAAVLLAIMITLYLVPNAVLRAWQEARVQALGQRIESAEWEVVAVSAEVQPDGRVKIPIPWREAGAVEAPEAPPMFGFEYLQLRFPAAAAAEVGWVECHYAGSVPDLALNWADAPPTGLQAAAISFPVYRARWLGEGGGWTRCDHLLLPAGLAGAELRRLRNPAAFPLLPTWWSGAPESVGLVQRWTR